MPVRIYDISKKLGLENKEILAKAKAMGIAAAKVPSSVLDKISAEWLEEELVKTFPEAAARLAPKPASEPQKPAPVEEKIVLINAPPPKPQIIITATGAELYRLAERILKQEIQFRLDISETEHGEPLRLCLTKDASQKALETNAKLDLPIRVEIDERTKDLLRAAYYASRHNSTEGWINLAEYGGAVKKLDPTFQPQNFGERGLGSLLRRVPDLFDLRNDESNPIVYYLRMKDEKPRSFSPVPTKESGLAVPSHTKMVRGKIHNLRLGFGFIMPDDGSENLFFHATEVVGCTIFDLKPGDVVEYESVMNEKGPCARKVRRLVMQLLYKAYACVEMEGGKFLLPGYLVEPGKKSQLSGDKIQLELVDGFVETKILGTKIFNYSESAAFPLRTKPGFYNAIQVPDDFLPPGIELGANVFLLLPGQ